MLNKLDTPAALIDEPCMQRNIARMQSRMHSMGVSFRPHVKTSKCIEVARRQRDAGARGITVSTLKEAEQFYAAGFADILYAVTLAPHKVEHAMALLHRGCDLQLVVDSIEAAEALLAGARQANLQPRVLIEIDVDGHRSGVKPGDPLLLEIGRRLHDGGLTRLGVMTHAGSSYNYHTEDALIAIAEQERSLCVNAAERLRGAGLGCAVVSVGSTPTALSARSLEGVTEVRAGVYVFFDLVMTGVGVCRTDEVALSVLTTVIGHQADRGWAIVDAGWMAMSRDRGTQQQPVDQGYGLVCNEEGRVIEGLLLSAANQEHGIVSYRTPAAADVGDIVQAFPIGTRLRILPNHACATGAQHMHYRVLNGDRGIATWPRFNGW
jgi:D-serine deaminase-like pyridoxal phosphate-dependent protein